MSANTRTRVSKVTERTAIVDVLQHPDQFPRYRDAGFGPDLFGWPEHTVIWRALEEIADSCGVVSADVLRSRLETTGQIRDDGLSLAYLATCEDACPRQGAEHIETLYSDLATHRSLRDYLYTEDEQRQQLLKNPSLLWNGFLDHRIDQLDAFRKQQPADRANALLNDVTILQQPIVPMLIRGIWQTRSLGVLLSATGVGKTHLILAMMAAIGLNRSLFGRFAVELSGPSLLVAAEGQNGIPARIRAIKASHGLALDEHLGISIYTSSMSLLSDADVSELIRRLPSAETFALVALDTWAKLLLPGDENSQHDTGLGLKAMERIRDATSACVVANHHLGASGDRERGSTALKAGVDTALRITPERGGIRRVTTDKQRDAIEAPPWHFRLEACEDSCIPVYVERSAEDKNDDRGAVPDIPEAMLDHARRLVRAHPNLSKSRIAERLSGRRAVALKAAQQAKSEAK